MKMITVGESASRDVQVPPGTNSADAILYLLDCLVNPPPIPFTIIGTAAGVCAAMAKDPRHVARSVVAMAGKASGPSAWCQTKGEPFPDGCVFRTSPPVIGGILRDAISSGGSPPPSPYLSAPKNVSTNCMDGIAFVGPSDEATSRLAVAMGPSNAVYQAVLEFVAPGDTVVFGGDACGFWSSRCAVVVGCLGSVLSFDPSPISSVCTTKNLSPHDGYARTFTTLLGETNATRPYEAGLEGLRSRDAMGAADLKLAGKAAATDPTVPSVSIEQMPLDEVDVDLRGITMLVLRQDAVLAGALRGARETLRSRVPVVVLWGVTSHVASVALAEVGYTMLTTSTRDVFYGFSGEMADTAAACWPDNFSWGREGSPPGWQPSPPPKIVQLGDSVSHELVKAVEDILGGSLVYGRVTQEGEGDASPSSASTIAVPNPSLASTLISRGYNHLVYNSYTGAPLDHADRLRVVDLNLSELPLAIAARVRQQA